MNKHTNLLGDGDAGRAPDGSAHDLVEVDFGHPSVASVLPDLPTVNYEPTNVNLLHFRDMFRSYEQCDVVFTKKNNREIAVVILGNTFRTIDYIRQLNEYSPAVAFVYLSRGSARPTEPVLYTTFYRDVLFARLTNNDGTDLRLVFKRKIIPSEEAHVVVHDDYINRIGR